MADIIDFNAYKEDNSLCYYGELICVKCLRRWIGVVPIELWLKDLECHHCKEKGYVISTGQQLKE